MILLTGMEDARLTTEGDFAVIGGERRLLTLGFFRPRAGPIESLTLYTRNLCVRLEPWSF